MLNIFDSAPALKEAPPTTKPAPYGLSDARKKLRWLIENPPENLALPMDISPAMATAMMERNADDEWRNRPHSQRGLRRYTDAMRKGWQYTGETIVFSVTGRLLNGQHRLLACIEAGVRFPCLVAFSVADDAFKFMDIGIARTAGHIFAIEGVKNANWAAATARLVRAYLEDTSWNGKDKEVENDDLLGFYQKHEDIQDSLVLARKMYEDRLLPMRWAGALHYICSQKNKEEATDFFQRVATGLGLTKTTDPRYLVRKKLEKNNRAGTDKEADVYLAAYVVQAWNAHRRNEARTLFRWRGAQRPHETFPRAI